MEVGSLVASLKGSSSCSYRDLARRADVAVSTITRFRSGAMEPSVDTLARLLAAAGYELVAARRPLDEPPTVGRLARAWTDRSGRVTPDWTRWRALLDGLALEPDRLAEAIYPAPPPSGSPIIDALLAAVAEKLADDAGLRRPAWTQAIPPLLEPWRPPGRRLHEDCPGQFLARGLVVDAESLWRDPATVGA